MVAQAFNDATTTFLTMLEKNELDHKDTMVNYESSMANNAQVAASELRRCQPHRYKSGRNKGNDSWTRLMTGK